MSKVIKYPIDKIVSVVRELFEENIVLQELGSEALQYDDEISGDALEAICTIIDAVVDENKDI
jgi:hypothetical protein